MTAYFEICSRVDDFCNNNNRKWERVSYCLDPGLALFIGGPTIKREIKRSKMLMFLAPQVLQ